MKSIEQERAEAETLAVLRLLAQKPGVWHTWDPYGPECPMPAVDPAFPAGTPPKRILTRMKRLLKRGLAHGCGCGCRGDFEISEKGLAYLEAAKS